MISTGRVSWRAKLTVSTLEYLVDGTALPDVEFDVGESYAGQIALSSNSSDELFFWFFPSTNAAAENEILIWLNGGVCAPICSRVVFVPTWLELG